MTDAIRTAISLTPHLIESLYVEAMVLADEARHYFEVESKDRVAGGGTAQRVEISCESLRLTTRLMHCIAWLLNQKAYHAGELSYAQLRGQGRMLGSAAPGETDVIAHMPAEARRLIGGSEDLFVRIKRLETGIQNGDVPGTWPDGVGSSHVHKMQEDLLNALLR